ncbi:hypothetical protein BGZ95_004902 [Linnemannia exigua]|uniref:HMG box domain-containing protein n=1 Tax=Linnemannia exigua TaxID=604196 RepID=A0AAD4D2I4_9FUNG|nr:hypothetical protein BGZ95_004902 [Linnemannia exigua]
MSLTPTYSNVMMDPYNATPLTAASLSPSTAPSRQISEIPKFTVKTPIKIEEVEDDTVMANNNHDFLETTAMSEDHDDLSAHFLDHVKGHHLEMQHGEYNLDQSSCFSSPYLSSEVAFESSSFTRFLSHADSQIDDEYSSTKPFSRLHSFYAPEQDLGYDHEDDEEQQQQQHYRYHRESSLASAVTRRFSGLSLGSVAESPMNHASSISSEVPNACLASGHAPFSFSSALSSATSLFTSPSTSSAYTTSAVLASAPATTANTTTSATTATTSPSSVSASASAAPSSSVFFPPTASALHQKRRKVLKQKLQVPRPKNCFMLYRSKVLPMIMAELGSINNKIISKIAAERWRAETEPVKIWYRDMAKYGKEEHARNNPGYKYAPLNKMRMMATSAVNRPVQKPQQTTKEVATSAERADGVEVDAGVHTNRDYFDESSPSRRRSTRQRQQQQQHRRQQQIASRPGLRSEGSKRRSSSGLGLDGHSSSRLSSHNKKLREVVVHQASYPPLNFSTDSSSRLDSADMTGFSSFDQQQQQQQNRVSTYQSHHPLAGPSIYNLTADKNASEETLVDPIDHWTTHRYQDGRNYLDTSSSSFLSLSNPSGDYKNKLDGRASMMSSAKLMMIDPKILLEKELPPLPHETKTTVHSSSHTHSHNNATNKTTLFPPLASSCPSHSNNNDPDSIMTQMFLEYNPPPPSQQQLQQQPHHYYCSPQNQHHFQLHVHEQNPFQQAFHQHTQQQQYHHQQSQQHQHHQHQRLPQGGTTYYIKAACPTGFMSFTGATATAATATAAQGSMSLMDMLSSPWAKS